MRIVLFVLFVSLSLFAKEEFYYGFINNDGKQMDYKTKKEIKDGFVILQNIRTLMNDGDVKGAFKHIKDFEKSNKLPILKSDMILLSSEILSRMQSKRYILEGEKNLENAINSSMIREESLLDAYMLLVKLKLQTNKAKEAQYFAQTMLDNYDNPLKQAYAKIAMAEIFIFQRDYKKAQKLLGDVLSKTSDIAVATVVADKLFEVYLAEKTPEKAYDLIDKVLNTNMNFYLKDLPYAIIKATQLIKADMPELGIRLLEEVLKYTKNVNTAQKVKMMLADAYMTIPDLQKAKEYYKDVMTENPESSDAQKAKVAIDEILMREGKVEAGVIADKYKDINSMQQKALFQELLESKKQKNYAQILKSKKVYDKIPDEIAMRFGFKNVKEVYNDVQLLFIKEYLKNGKCRELDKTMQEIEKDTLLRLVEDNEYRKPFFECLLESPDKKIYDLANEHLKATRNGEVYLYMERIAFALGLYDESLNYSQKIEMLRDRTMSMREFLDKFMLAKTIDNKKMIEDMMWFGFANPDFLDFSKNIPMIADYYYDFYFYLIGKNENAKANEILLKLANYKTINKIRIYSPFVEIALSDIEKNKKNYKGQIALLEGGLKTAKRVNQNDLSRIHYELAKAYKNLGQTTASSENLEKCKKTTDKLSIWKKMCDRFE